ncbi:MULTISPECIES: hypothetical protein [Gammaproteobacteria]|jgi:hypothetical protein|uniref:hypothetical protein n=1 Tax=Gammaproteobacteria TaxID=1236 RepID=UPI000531BC7A|nr:hypothetical protein [Proteus mirabilis]AND13474.1 hypothetical protein AOUC001_11460 [Proteus mirabilis]AUT92400.1 hypothetical protein MC46_011965 [Proteus mirabilis]EJD6328064.1 hypothetical protein [Proteus mirabilis]EJD6534282.1 hypothetical protein [Proteus mirabilis]EKV7173893.1 hypothetical protein [Proteus mirabilis]
MSNQNIKEIKDSDGNVKFRIAKIGVFDTSPTPSIEDLVKRIESLEKQLADMQKATSCDLDILSTRITAVESFSR